MTGKAATRGCLAALATFGASKAAKAPKVANRRPTISLEIVKIA